MKKPVAASPAGTAKGARRVAEVPADVLEALNAGQRETANLVEGLALDDAVLLRAAAPELSDSAVAQMQAARAAKLGIVQRMQLAARLLHAHYGPAAYAHYADHTSDTVRGWAAFAAMLDANAGLATRLDRIRPLADDPHFGVREWAWMALRPHLAAQLPEALQLLTTWAQSERPNLRRFASEATRPRGVWCAHIHALKQQPELARPLLEPLRADPVRYVQDSVGNWLNDAAKSRPDWARQLVVSWLAATAQAAATQYIARRALRSL